MRVLYLSHRVPYAPNRGDRIRAFHTLRCLRQLGIDVHLVAMAHDEDERSRQGELAALVTGVDIVRVPRTRNHIRGAAGLVTSVPLTHLLLDSREMPGRLTGACARFQPDVVLAFCSGMARFALEPPLARLPFVLDMVDVDSEKWRALAAGSRRPLAWIYAREARLLAGFEAHAAMTASTTLVINQREFDAMARLAPGASVVVLPNGVDVDYFKPTGAVPRQPEIVFAGVFDYAPNASGAEWLLREVWPLVRARVPEARLVFAGSGPSRSLRAAAAADGRVEVTGAVADLRPHLWRATVSAAPLFVARGLQNKVVEALAAGLRVVTTTAVAEGLPAALADQCRVADEATPFAEALVSELARAPETAVDVPLDDYTWERAMSPLPRVLEHAVEGHRTAHSSS